MSDLVATIILTGRRPSLLKATMTALHQWHPAVLRDTHVIVLHNGGDAETSVVLDEWDDLIDARIVTGELLPIAHASELLVHAAMETELPYLFRLEDDWQATGRTHEFLQTAVWVLEDEPEVAQVRLRDDRERVLPTHMVTKAPLVWHDRGHYRYSPDAHVTHNPSLWRMEVAAVAYPADIEREMQDNVRRAGWTASAQLTPGEFTHLGEGELSLKRKVKRGRTA